MEFDEKKIKKFILAAGAAAMLILALLMFSTANAMGPASSSAATATPLPAEARRAVRLKNEYNQVRDAANSLVSVTVQAQADRGEYVHFMDGQSALGRDTSLLEKGLSIFDSQMTLAKNEHTSAVDTLADRSGFDSSGNVKNNDAVESVITKALLAANQEQIYLTQAVAELHSDLNLYHQVWSVNVPSIPKLRLAAIVLNPTYPATAPAPTLSASELRRAGRLGNEINQIKAALSDLDTVSGQVEAYRPTYVSFKDGQDKLGRDTSMLSTGLSIYDSYMKLAEQGHTTAADALSSRSGFDAKGNIIDPNAVETSINTALSGYAQEQLYLTKAAYELHSDLNLYHQVWTISVPNLPKLHLSPLVLNPNYGASPTATPKP